MKLFDIDILRKDPDQNNLFNFFHPTFKLSNSYEQQPFVVGREQMMRLDLVCNEIYQTTDFLDFLLNLNDIDNPLNILENDVIYFTAPGIVDAFRIKDSVKEETRNLLLNSNKASKTDKNRQKYIENNFSLPPTVAPVPGPGIKIEGDSFILGG